jgi:GNAT superfamily N-acetyltransferase
MWFLREVMGFCLLMIGLDLDMLCTRADYRCRGAGSMLVRWGCEIADSEGAGAYIDATKAGAPLYAKQGFVDRSDPAAESEIVPMTRN